MGRLYCRCLNVVVHHAKAIESGRLLPATALLPEQCKDRIARETLLELELDVAGVVTVSTVLEYSSFRCLKELARVLRSA